MYHIERMQTDAGAFLYSQAVQSFDDRPDCGACLGKGQASGGVQSVDVKLAGDPHQLAVWGKCHVFWGVGGGVLAHGSIGVMDCFISKQPG